MPLLWFVARDQLRKGRETLIALRTLLPMNPKVLALARMKEKGGLGSHVSLSCSAQVSLVISLIVHKYT